MKKLNKAIDLLEEAVEELEDKMYQMEEKADNRNSGEMTEKEQERYDELYDMKGEIENALDYIRVFYV